MKFLVFPAVDDRTLAALQAAAPDAIIANVRTEREAVEAIRNADGMYGNLTPRLLEAATRLRWVQTPIAGLEHYMFPALAASDVTLTNMRGIYSDAIADQAMGYVLMFARGLHVYVRRQLRSEWRGGVPVVPLAGATMGVVGLGGIGTEVARRASACQMRVVATNAVPVEKPDFVDQLWDSSGLDELLAASDFIVSCVPHTPDTVRLFDADRIARMKRSAFFINISRGVVVDLAALTEALTAGTIAGVALDVFETEPLPPDHPLWSMENAILTPHVAGADPGVGGRRLAVVCENLRRFVSGESLTNVVDKRRWC